MLNHVRPSTALQDLCNKLRNIQSSVTGVLTVLDSSANSATRGRHQTVEIGGQRCSSAFECDARTVSEREAAIQQEPRAAAHQPCWHVGEADEVLN